MIDAKTIEELRGLLVADTSTDWQTIRADPAEGADVWWICAKNAAGQEVELGSLQGGFPHPTREARARLIVAMRNALPALLDAAERAVRHHNKSRAESAESQLSALRAENERLRKALADDLRAGGWAVAVHNDYRLNGEAHTFWLFTKDGRAIKGEGLSDAEALDEVRRARSELEAGHE